MEQHPESVPDPYEFLEFRTLRIVDSSGRTSVHKVPVDVVSHLCDALGSCICGPDVTESEWPFVEHWPLDGRYYE